MEIQSIYQRAIKYASARHAEQNQTIPGTNLPYTVHISNVAMEILIASQHTSDFRKGFAIQLALLHDTIEDTATTAEDLSVDFSPEVSAGVLALTKNKDLPKAERMQDSLQRIKALPKEVWAVKLADRITNLQSPPEDWDKEKKENYLKEAAEILSSLEGGNNYLEERLSWKIEEYKKYI